MRPPRRSRYSHPLPMDLQHLNICHLLQLHNKSVVPVQRILQKVPLFFRHTRCHCSLLDGGYWWEWSSIKNIYPQYQIIYYFYTILTNYQCSKRMLINSCLYTKDWSLRCVINHPNTATSGHQQDCEKTPNKIFWRGEKFFFHFFHFISTKATSTTYKIPPN